MDIKPAKYNSFKLIFFQGAHNDLQLEVSGRIKVANGAIYFNYLNNNDNIGNYNSKGGVIKTLYRNKTPLYKRFVNGQLWISNDISELFIKGENIIINKKTLSLVGSRQIRSINSHLFKDIELLLPSSFYKIKISNLGEVIIKWDNINFNEQASISKESFLEYLIEQYKICFDGIDEICLGLSGGLDSRLELAILTHLNKKVNCYHYTAGTRETKLARQAACLASAAFNEFDQLSMASDGWWFLKELGYNFRWDGFFAPGLLYNVGLYMKAVKMNPNSPKLIMSTINGFKGRLYDKSNEIFNVNRNHAFSPSNIMNQYPGIMLDKIKEKALGNYSRMDISIDAIYPFIYKTEGRVSTRSTIFYENGMPIFDADKKVRELFSSMPKEDKEDQAFIKFAISVLNPELSSLPLVTSNMNTLERQFGLYSKIPGLRRLLNKFKYPSVHDAHNWYSDSDVSYIIQMIPEIQEHARNFNKGKQMLYIAQICRHLNMCQELKQVSYSIE